MARKQTARSRVCGSGADVTLPPQMKPNPGGKAITTIAAHTA